jgi:hypothetical protein
MGALAILWSSPSGTAKQILGLTIDNAKANCTFAMSSDGTWSDTVNYWYFCNTLPPEHHRLRIRLPQREPDVQPNGILPRVRHRLNVHVQLRRHRPQQIANAVFFYAAHFHILLFALFQHHQYDAPEQGSMFWYDPTTAGAFWDGHAG